MGGLVSCSPHILRCDFLDFGCFLAVLPDGSGLLVLRCAAIRVYMGMVTTLDCVTGYFESLVPAFLNGVMRLIKGLW
jgi:hypothetical protein